MYIHKHLSPKHKGDVEPIKKRVAKLKFLRSAFVVIILNATINWVIFIYINGEKKIEKQVYIILYSTRKGGVVKREPMLI